MLFPGCRRRRRRDEPFVSRVFGELRWVGGVRVVCCWWCIGSERINSIPPLGREAEDTLKRWKKWNELKHPRVVAAPVPPCLRPPLLGLRCRLRNCKHEVSTVGLPPSHGRMIDEDGRSIHLPSQHDSKRTASGLSQSLYHFFSVRYVLLSWAFFAIVVMSESSHDNKGW